MKRMLLASIVLVALVAASLAMKRPTDGWARWMSPHRDLNMHRRDAAAIAARQCMDKPCQGPVEVIWSNPRCEGDPVWIGNYFDDYAAAFKCSVAEAAFDTYNISSIVGEVLRTREYRGDSTCIGEPVADGWKRLHQCIPYPMSMSMALLSRVEDWRITPPESSTGPKPGLPFGLDPESCTYGVDCTNRFFEASWSSSPQRCSGNPHHAREQRVWKHEACHEEDWLNLNARTGCYHTEIRVELFAYGCEKRDPYQYLSVATDTAVSNASVVVGYCRAPTSFACSDPQDAPPPNDGTRKFPLSSALSAHSPTALTFVMIAFTLLLISLAMF